jgi:Family of unknown function (DUF5678)
MTVAKIQESPQPLRLDISGINLHITPEQFDRLCLDNPDFQLELTKDGEIITDSSAGIEQNQDIVHTFNHQGAPISYDIKDLYWNPQAYKYLKEQEELFSQCLPDLIEKYAGKYILFENNHVIDSDKNEDTLLSRIADHSSYDDRPAILCIFVPIHSVENKANA